MVLNIIILVSVIALAIAIGLLLWKLGKYDKYFLNNPPIPPVPDNISIRQLPSKVGDDSDPEGFVYRYEIVKKEGTVTTPVDGYIAQFVNTDITVFTNEDGSTHLRVGKIRIEYSFGLNVTNMFTQYINIPWHGDGDKRNTYSNYHPNYKALVIKARDGQDDTDVHDPRM